MALLAFGSESSQNFAGLAIFCLPSPIHKELQRLESDMQMAQLYLLLHLSVNSVPPSLLSPPRWHLVVGAVQGSL